MSQENGITPEQIADFIEVVSKPLIELRDSGGAAEFMLPAIPEPKTENQ